jgi:hypothetical protein
MNLKLGAVPPVSAARERRAAAPACLSAANRCGHQEKNRSPDLGDQRRLAATRAGFESWDYALVGILEASAPPSLLFGQRRTSDRSVGEQGTGPVVIEDPAIRQPSQVPPGERVDRVTIKVG